MRTQVPPVPAGLAPLKAQDGKSYTSILYGNGPGYVLDSGNRPNVTEAESSEWGQRKVVGLGDRVDGDPGRGRPGP